MIAEAPVVHIVDDDKEFRESVRWLLESADMTVRLYASAAEFLGSVESDAVGCLVTDLRMPGMSGLELQRMMNRQGIGLPIIVMTAHGDVDTAVQAMKEGAVDFIEKPFREQAFLDKVNAAVAESIERMKLRTSQADIASRLQVLSKREREVLEHIVEGHTNKMTARILGVSEKTVEAHRASIMDKTRTDSLVQLVKLVIKAREN